MTAIKKLELIHFGKFSDTVIDLSCGENVFCEANEWGKSTVTDFIIYMLYGFKKTAKKSITLEQNFLKKYLPWNDDSHILGAMELENDGRLIRIERKTFATGRTSLSVTDAGGNNLDILDPGAEFFGIDCETFMRTFLVRQTDIIFDGTDDIETALKNLVTTGDEQTSFDAALKVITDKKNKFQHGDRRSGRIFELPRLITDKKLECSMLSGRKDTLIASLLRYNEIKEKITALESTEKQLEQKRKACIGNDAKKIVLRAEQIMTERENYIKKLNADEITITEQDITSATEVFNNAHIASVYFKNADTELEKAQTELKNSKDSLSGVEYVATNEEKIVAHLAKKPKRIVPLIIVGAVLTVVFGILGIILSPYCFAGTVAGAIVLAVASFIQVKPKPILNKTNEELMADYEKYKTLSAKITDATTKYNNAKAEFDKQKDDMEKSNAEVLKIRQKYAINELSELSTLLVQSKNSVMLKEHIHKLDNELETLLCNKTLEEYKDLANYADGSDLGVLELDKMRSDVAQQKSELALSLAHLSKARIECDEIIEKINDLNSQIKAYEKELSEAEYQNNVLAIARDVLSEAYDKINSVYSPIISQKISPYLHTLTGGKYSEAILDRQFNIRIKYKGEYKELGFFSRGTADCVYFAVRLAMAEILEGEKKLPLVLDDPFWSFDTQRRKNAENLIYELSKNRQILVFCAK